MECWKCGGTGYIAKYAHIDNGICFACGGDGKLTVENRATMAREFLKTGAKRGGKVSHLMKVEHELLDKKELVLYRAGLIKEAKKMGLKPKAGFKTATLKKTMQEMLGRDERGMRPQDNADLGLKKKEPAVAKVAEPPKKVEPVKKAEPKPAPVPFVPKYRKLTEADEIYVQTGDSGEDTELFAKDGKFYNAEEHEIKNPFRTDSFGEMQNAQVNSFKPLGHPFLNYQSSLNDISEQLENYSERVASMFHSDYTEIFRFVEKEYPALISNVAFEDVNFFTDEPNSAGRYKVSSAYGVDSYKLEMSASYMLDFYDKEKSLSKETFDLYRQRMLKIQKKTLIHELAHAYHHQVLADRDWDVFSAKRLEAKSPVNNQIHMLYKMKVMKLQQLGWSVNKIQTLFRGGSPSDIETMKKVFRRPYGASNAMEMFTTASEALISEKGKTVLKSDHPDDYQMLKDAFKGVIEL